ncbi:MAG: cupin domain-containing protein [Pseudomonadota bacterium]|nr:cupin domain-containing protein [Pseudomonadota bacterium]
MLVNADFDAPVTIRPQDRRWVPSPTGGVERCMLDRVSLDGAVGEVARATSLVRFAPGSSFPTHTHGGGEEYLVLDGTFSDETGDFPTSTYVRNPIGTAHAPHTKDGCTIFVKLHQFSNDDTLGFDVDLAGQLASAPEIGGVRETLLHSTEDEQVRAVALEAEAMLDHDGVGGAELLVLEGALVVLGDDWPSGTWARQPDGVPLVARAGPEGATLWIKTGHLTAQAVAATTRSPSP